MQFTSGRFERNLDCFGEADGACVEAFLHPHYNRRGLRITGHDRTLNGRSSSPTRQCRRMQIEAAKAWRLEDRLRQDEAVSDHNRHVRRVTCKHFRRFRRAERFRRMNRNSGQFGVDVNRRFARFHASASRSRRLGVGSHDMVARCDNRGECRDRKVGRTHEDDAKRHVRVVRARAFGVKCRGRQVSRSARGSIGQTS